MLRKQNRFKGGEFMTSGSLALLLIILIWYIQNIYFDVKDGKKTKGILKVVFAFILVSAFCIIPNYIGATTFPTKIKGEDKQYIMSLNEVKKSNSGITIKLSRVFMDLDSINFTLGVKGKDKLVAVEIKKDTADIKPLQAIQGLWLGSRFVMKYGGYGATYNGVGFVDPIYIVCYLSNGEDITFKVEDKKNVREKTKYIDFNKEIVLGDRKVILKNFIQSLNSTTVNIDSNDGMVNLKVSILQNGKEIKLSKGMWSSAGKYCSYSYYCDEAINGKELEIKINDSDSGNEVKVDAN